MFGYTLDLCSDFFMDRAATYAQAIVKNNSLFGSVVPPVDCTRVQISRPGGTLYNQKVVYLGQKQKHFLTYRPSAQSTISYMVLWSCRW